MYTCHSHPSLSFLYCRFLSLPSKRERAHSDFLIEGTQRLTPRSNRVFCWLVKNNNMLGRIRGTLSLVLASVEPTSPARSRRSGEGSAVGLRIVIEGSSPAANVIIKSTLRSPPPKPPAGASGLPELSFLRACFLCKNQLSPEKDVYMYRGDQAFCSLECRSRQIFLDERRERCASVLDQVAPFRGHGRKKSQTGDCRRIPAAA